MVAATPSRRRTRPDGVEPRVELVGRSAAGHHAGTRAAGPGSLGGSMEVLGIALIILSLVLIFGIGWVVQSNLRRAA